MNEIITTIIVGLPYTALALACVLGILLYGWVLGWAIDTEHDRMVTFMIALLIFLFISFVYYMAGVII